MKKIEDAKTFNIPEIGECLGFEYQFRNKKYIQLELNVPMIETLSEFIIDLDIPGVQSITDLASLPIGQFLSTLTKGKVAVKLLPLIILNEDMTPTTEAEFRQSTARQFVPFITEAVKDFFCLNGELLTPILGRAQSILEAVKKFLEVADQFPNWISSLKSLMVQSSNATGSGKAHGKKR